MRRGISRSTVSRVTVALAVLSGLMSVASPAGAASDCAGASSLSLRGFPPSMQNQPPFFYYTPEGVPGTFVVGGSIDPGNVSVRYDTPPGSPLPATPGTSAPADYRRIEGLFQFTNNESPCLAVDDFRDVPTFEEALTDEAGVEELEVVLSQPSGVGLGISRASMYVLDDDGTMRARLPEPTAKSMSEPLNASSSSIANIPVLRAGAGAGTINYQISGATGDITSPTTGAVSFIGGLGIIKISIAHDTVDEPNEVVTITISGSGGANVQGDTSFDLTILDNDAGGGGGGNTIAPDAWFHHPKHGERYRHDTFLANTIHMFAKDNEGQANITAGQLALRKKMNSGACKWWKGGRWRNSGCAQPRWINLGAGFADGARRFWPYANYPTLPPSVRTRIKNYRVLGRAYDTDGNRSRLITGENRNTFEITRR